MTNKKRTPRVDNSTIRFNHFEFSFEMIMDEPEARTIFKQFCDQVLHSSESLSFIENVEKFKVMRHIDNRHKLCETMIETFVRANAVQEINIDGRIRRGIIEKFEAFICDKQLQQINNNNNKYTII